MNPEYSEPFVWLIAIVVAAIFAIVGYIIGRIHEHRVQRRYDCMARVYRGIED